ncbi:unnamed protein product, partial [Oppiella nova]
MASIVSPLKSRLHSFGGLLRHQSIRCYRFGNRVRNKGFYSSLDLQLNEKFVRNDSKLSAEELREKRNKLFDWEKKRQSEAVTRMEKISVSVVNPFGNDDHQTIDLLMNRFISTPHHCSQHIHQLISDRSVVALIDDKNFWDIHRPLVSDCSLRFKHFKEPNPHFVNKTFWRNNETKEMDANEAKNDELLYDPKSDEMDQKWVDTHRATTSGRVLISDRSVVALIDDKNFWDIHRPLVSDCRLRFKHFKEPNPHFVNKTFWRSCSLMMGSVIEKAFKDNIEVNLHSWPKPDINSGSFVYDTGSQEVKN